MLRGPYLHTAARQWVDDIGFQPETRRKYLATLETFDRRLQRNRKGVRFADVTPDEVREFVFMREDGRPRADHSRKKILSICWMFWDWASSQEIHLTAGNPATRLRAQARTAGAIRGVRPKHWLGENRARLLVATTRGDGRDPDRVRDAFILAVFLYTGLRLAELRALRWHNVDLATGLLVFFGKDRRPSQVSLNQAAQRLLFEWRSRYVTGYGSTAIDDLPVVPRMVTGIVGRPCQAEPQVRYRQIQWGRPIARPSSIGRIVTARALEAGLGHVAAHDLRRSFAGIMQDRGAPLEEISKALRHQELETTRIYLEDKPELAAALADYDLG
jgi:integrase/recombinase XerC